MRFLARICYNDADWTQPAGIAPRLEGRKNYARRFGFGHEEWLFRRGWEIDGWRYGFLQGVNKAAHRRLTSAFDVMLYTIDDKKRRRLVASINEVHQLDADEAGRVLKLYRRNGWLQQMRKEVGAVNGVASALGSGQFAPNILNVRFRPAAVSRLDATLPSSRHAFVLRRNRYRLYDFPPKDVQSVERSLPRHRRAHQGPIRLLKIFRRETQASEYSVEHRAMQRRLISQLEGRYGADRVDAELNFVDATVTLPNETVFYEIKSDEEPRTVIRHALGQLTEYAFHSRHLPPRRVRLVIVGRNPLTAADRAYLRTLQTRFRLPVDYLVVKP